MIRVYCYEKCSTCKKALKWLTGRGVEFETADIRSMHPDKETLRTLWKRSGLPLRRFFNTSGVRYREEGLSAKLSSMDDEAQLSLLASDGMLVKRPLLVCESAVIPGFREADWERALS